MDKETEDEYFNKEFLSLAYAAIRFSPYVAIDKNYGLLLNISGCAHLFGGERQLLLSIENFFNNLGFYIKKSIAPHPMLAKALAYYHSDTLCDGSIKKYINPLPIDALFMDSSINDTLHDLGIITMAALLKLPRKMLVKRFGINLVQAIDQLCGNIYLPPNYLKEQPKFIFNEHFSSAIRTHEYFMNAVTVLIKKALMELDKHYLYIRSMTLVIKDIFKKDIKLTVESSRANNRGEHWLELLFLKTSEINFNDGIDSLSLIITHFEQAEEHTHDFSKKLDTTNELSFITDKLKSRLGDKAIFHLRITEKHLPELAVKRDFTLKPKDDRTKAINLPPRPVRLLKKPFPIFVIALLPDNPPAKIICQNRSMNILHACGPERIEHEWWTGINQQARDYFYVEGDCGKRLWIYSTGEPKQWFIHGVFL